MMQLCNQSIPIMARYKIDGSFNQSNSQTRRNKLRDPCRHELCFLTLVTSFDCKVGDVVHVH